MVVNDAAVAMSEDHKPYNDSEKERIVKAGGFVSMKRVQGDLAVSRALGDFVYKNTELPQPEQQVSPEPEIRIHERDSSADQVRVGWPPLNGAAGA